MVDRRVLTSLPALLLTAFCSSLSSVGPVVSDDSVGRDRARAARFESEIRPILVQHCIECHGASKQEGGLRLDSADGLDKGGDSGAALLAGFPSESLLIEALKYDGLEMPPDAPLAKREIEQFEHWIAEGAVWPEGSAALRTGPTMIVDEDRQWWAYQPIVRQSPPAVADEAWLTNDIDRFILSTLEANHLTTAPRAPPHTLVRRLYYDLLGVPPTPEELLEACRQLELTSQKSVSLESDRHGQAAFDLAWERLVERLLEDPRYGEHWARHWLDLVRYSESDGWNQDAYRPDIWRYRDYVIDSFNCDKPYPDFVREQLAGDELDASNPQYRIAVGFLRLGIYEYNQRDARSHWDDIINEITDVTADVFLGQSLACARCHDHKFDPLPQRDYFQLRAFFEPLIWRDDVDAATDTERSHYEYQLALWQQATHQLQSQIEALIEPYHRTKWESTVDKFPLDIQACYFKPANERSSWEEQMTYLISRQFEEEAGGPLKSMSPEDKTQLEDLERKLAAWDELKPTPLPKAMSASNHLGRLTPTTIPSDPDHRAIDPGFLTVMSQLDLPCYTSDAGAANSTHQSSAIPRMNDSIADKRNRVTLVSRPDFATAASTRRLQLANWIGSRHNPLTARVIVNRIWQQHFGQGLVATANDFGRMGKRPSHPGLLDWLADEFVSTGWSFKKLHKHILMSSTWRQSAHHPHAREYESIDPSDQWLWRAPVRRLQAEQIRDAMLVASGELIQQVGGPPVDELAPRRALYVKSFRNNLENFLSTFDRAGGLKSVAVRDSTTTPIQALLLINGKYTVDRADNLANRLMQTGDLSVDRLLERLCLTTWGRPPHTEERARCLDFLRCTADQSVATIDPQRGKDLCHVLLNSNEFLYIE